jgi:hypothetical protein
MAKKETKEQKEKRIGKGTQKRGSCNIDWKKYEKYLRGHCEKRGVNVMWKDVDNEIDFMMGAHAIMGFCDEMDKLPSDVVFGYMRGGNHSLCGLEKQYEYYEKERVGNPNHKIKCSRK